MAQDQTLDLAKLLLHRRSTSGKTLAGARATVGHTGSHTHAFRPRPHGIRTRPHLIPPGGSGCFRPRNRKPKPAFHPSCSPSRPATQQP
jgi:hypothetical protein